MMKWLNGRAGRREYWVYVAGVFALSFLPAGGLVTKLVLTVFLGLVLVRRFHDIGKSGWWALGAMLAPGASLALLAITSLDNAAVAGLAIELVLLVWIGAMRGEAGDNRFGPPPPFTWRRLLTLS